MTPLRKKAKEISFKASKVWNDTDKITYWEASEPLIEAALKEVVMDIVVFMKDHDGWMRTCDIIEAIEQKYLEGE
jgi:hypothetical protein